MHCKILTGALFLVFLAYGQTASLFDKSGRLSQVELALKASSSGGSVLGALGRDVVVVVSWAPAQEAPSEHIRASPRCVELCATMGFCSAGVGADASHLCDKLFDDVCNHDYMYGSAPSVWRLAKNLASYVHESTLSLRHRPFGVRCLVLGTEHRAPTPLASSPASASASASASATPKLAPCLYEIDPLGNLYKCTLSGVGPYAEQLLEQWPGGVNPTSLDAADLTQTCLRVLEKTLEKEGYSLRAHNQRARLEVMVAGPGVSRTGQLSPAKLARFFERQEGKKGAPRPYEYIEAALQELI